MCSVLDFGSERSLSYDGDASMASRRRLLLLLVSYMPLALQQCELEFLAVTKPHRSVLALRSIAAKKGI